MSINRKYTEKVNNAEFENNDNLTAAELVLQEQWEAAGGLGYYQKTNLQDIIDNFMVTYVGADKVIKSAPRHEVAFWGQRCIQELSYDVLYSEKQIELELNPEKLEFPLPSDYVNYVKVSWLDFRGQERTVHPARRTTAKQGILQDSNFNYLYDQDGELLTANRSEAINRYQDPNSALGSGSNASDFYYGNFDEDNYSYYYNIYFGRRYGLDPQYSNTNGTFVIDTYKGMIYFDPSFGNNGINQGRGVDGSEDNMNAESTIVSLRYISDGLQENGDLANVYVHKLAEEAVYASILYGLTKVRPSTVSLAALYKKEASAARKNAKIRFMNLKKEEMAQVFRGKAKWIKH